MRSSYFGVLLLAASFLLPVSAAAQQQLGDLTDTRSSNAAFYQFREPGDITITISVWGGVVHPGLYEVPDNARLNTVLTLAGGLPLGVLDSRGSHVDRSLQLRLLRHNGTQYESVYEQFMRNGIVLAESNPTLEDGDFVVVELEERLRDPFTWRDALSVTTAVAALALAAERVVNVMN